MTRRGKHHDDEAITPLSAAGETARREIIRIAREFGARMITRRVDSWQKWPVTRDVEPLAGISAAVALEIAAEGTARGYIRLAREAGHGWDQIGQVVGLRPGPHEAGVTLADIAYDYASGRAGRQMTRPFWWNCRSCDQLVVESGTGLISGPADNETGHADGCRRLAAAIATWDAQAPDRAAQAAERAARAAGRVRDPEAEWDAELEAGQ